MRRTHTILATRYQVQRAIRPADAMARNIDKKQSTETIPITPSFDLVEYREIPRNKIPVFDFLECRKIPEKHRNCSRAAGIEQNTDRPVLDDGVEDIHQGPRYYMSACLVSHIIVYSARSSVRDLAPGAHSALPGRKRSCCRPRSNPKPPSRINYNYSFFCW